MSKKIPLPFAVDGIKDDFGVEEFFKKLIIGHPKRRILLVGETGTGKSSVAKAFGRWGGWYHPAKGEDWLNKLDPIVSLLKFKDHEDHKLTNDLYETIEDLSKKNSIVDAARCSDNEVLKVIRFLKPWNDHKGYAIQLNNGLLRAQIDDNRSKFVEIDLSTIPETMARSELFGHTKGAYTDAGTHRLGAIQQADGGLLFLDEVDSASKEMQANLLGATRVDHFLVRSLGADVDVKVYPRVISACCSLSGIRQELAFRLGQMVLYLLPLRKQQHRIIPIAESFLKRWCDNVNGVQMTIGEDAKKYFRNYEWPGNLREMESLISNIVFRAGGAGKEVTIDDIEWARKFAVDTKYFQKPTHQHRKTTLNRSISVTKTENSIPNAISPEQKVVDTLISLPRQLSTAEIDALHYEATFKRGNGNYSSFGIGERTWQDTEWHGKRHDSLEALGRSKSIPKEGIPGGDQFQELRERHRINKIEKQQRKKEKSNI